MGSPKMFGEGKAGMEVPAAQSHGTMLAGKMTFYSSLL